MRVIQTRNDIIRLIFNPKTDGLCLSDFLIVRDNEDNFLGQIIEIYDDKFNQEENVATIRLVYRILSDHQVVPYDNFTPSRECEIAKIKLEEIEKCLNIDKITVPFGISTKNKKIVNINLDFFNNNPVIFADKLDEVNCAFENIAQKLKTHKKVVVIDYTGNLNIQNAKRIKAKDDFKLPLDFYSLEYIWHKALNELSIEAQAELEDMFIELQKFVTSTEDKYIPFPRFIKVIEQQYKATPAVELKLLLTRLKKYWAQDLFSRSKKEFQGISKAIQKEDVLIVDLSNLKLEWHREFLEFVVRQIRDYDAYLLLRLNENNSNPEIINNLYLKNPKLNIIPSISYGFVKLPQVMEFAKNYILYKTLNPRRDFGFANFQVASLNSSSFLMFGKDTMDFMFVLKNYVYDEETLQEKEDKKIYIDLNLELEEMTSVELAGGDFELKNIHIQNTHKNLQRNGLSNAVSLDEVLPQAGQNDIKDDTKDEEIENITETPDTEEFQDIPLVKEEISEENIEETPQIEETEEIKEIEETKEAKKIEETGEIEENEALKEEAEEVLEEKQEELSENSENISENLPENEPESASENLPYTLEEVGASSTDAPDIIDDESVSDKTNDTVPETPIETEDNSIENKDDEAQNSNMAELIEASLKNDEEYMKELSKKEAAIDENADKKDVSADEIPVAEEDLDYFINPVDEEIQEEQNETEIAQQTSDTEELQDDIVTTEMIEDAAANEELANELEEQARAFESSNNASEKETPFEELKKNSSNEELEDKKEEQPKDLQADEAQKEETKENAEPDTSLHQIKAEADNILADEHDPKEITAAIETMEAKEALSVDDAETKQNNPLLDDAETAQNESIPSEEISDETAPKEETQKEEIQKEETPNEEAKKEAASENASESEPVIIVKEKPNLLIDDFTQEDEPAQADEAQKEDEISLKDLAQKSIDARFDEVIGESAASEAKNKKTAQGNKLKISENVSIDLDAIKNGANKESVLPVFNNEDETEETDYDFEEGMKVIHEKYGTGSILKVVKYSNRCLLQIEFEETGKRLLDPKIARIKPV